MPADPEQFEQRLIIVAEALAALIAGDPYLALAPAVPVFTERKGDIGAMIAEAMGRLGLCVAVAAADGDSLERTGSEGLALRVRVIAQISEKVLFNQSACQKAGIAYRPALAVATRIMKRIDRQPNGLDPADGAHMPGLNEFLLADDRPFELLKTPSDVIYEVSAYTKVEI